MKRSIVCAALLGMLACNASAETKIVKIGSGAPKSGGIAELGQDNELGAQLAIDNINAAGLLIGGQKIRLQLVGKDDAGNAKTGVKVAQQIVQSGAVAVVGHLNSGVSMPANQIYAAAGMAQVSPSSTNPEYTLSYANLTPKGNHSAYRVVANDIQQGHMLAKWLIKRNAKRVALLDDATQYGHNLAQYVDADLKQKNINVVVNQSLTDTTTDFESILNEVKNAQADYIFWGGMDDTGAALGRQMKELGLEATLLSGDAVCTFSHFIELADKAAEGTTCSAADNPLSTMKKGVWFAKHFEQKNQRKVQLYAPFAYDAVYAIVEAMKIAQSTEREAIAAAMPRVDFEGVTGRIRFDAHGDIQNGAVTIKRVVDGEFKVIDVLR